LRDNLLNFLALIIKSHQTMCGALAFSYLAPSYTPIYYIWRQFTHNVISTLRPHRLCDWYK